MKKLEKEIFKKEFINYIQKNNLIVEYDFYSISRKNIYIRKNVKQKEFINSNVDEILFIKKFNEISGKDYFIDFLNEMFKKKEMQPLILDCLIKKEPSPRDYSYETEINDIQKILEKNSIIYFNYVNREKFLKNLRRDRIEIIFEKLSNQEQKEGLIDTILKVSDFLTNIDNELFLKALINNKILNKKKYIDCFPKVKEVNIKDENIFDSYENKDLYSFLIDEYKIDVINKNKEYGVNAISYEIEMLFHFINKRKIPELNITNVSYLRRDDKKIELTYFGKPLNEDKIKSFCNYLIIEVINNIGSVDKANTVNAAIVKTTKKYLNETLEIKSNIATKKQKI